MIMIMMMLSASILTIRNELISTIFCSAYVPSIPPNVQRNTKNNINIGIDSLRRVDKIDISRTIVSETEETLKKADAHEEEWDYSTTLMMMTRTEASRTNKNSSWKDNKMETIVRRDDNDDAANHRTIDNTGKEKTRRLAGLYTTSTTPTTTNNNTQQVTQKLEMDPFDISDVLAEAQAALEAAGVDDDWTTMSKEITSAKMNAVTDSVPNRVVSSWSKSNRMVKSDGDDNMGRRIWARVGNMIIERSKDAFGFLAQELLQPDSRFKHFSKEFVTTLQDQAVHAVHDHFLKDKENMVLKRFSHKVNHVASEETVKMTNQQRNMHPGGDMTHEKKTIRTVKIPTEVIMNHHSSKENIELKYSGAFALDHHIYKMQDMIDLGNVFVAQLMKKGWVNRVAQPDDSLSGPMSQTSTQNNADDAKVAFVSSISTPSVEITTPPSTSDSILNGPSSSSSLSTGKRFFMREAFLSKSVDISSKVQSLIGREEVVSASPETTAPLQSIVPAAWTSRTSGNKSAPAFVLKTTILKSKSEQLVADANTVQTRRLSPVADLAAKFVKILIEAMLQKLILSSQLGRHDAFDAPQMSSMRFAIQSVFLSRLLKMTLPRATPLYSSKVAHKPQIPYFARYVHHVDYSIDGDMKNTYYN